MPGNLRSVSKQIEERLSRFNQKVNWALRGDRRPDLLRLIQKLHGGQGKEIAIKIGINASTVSQYLMTLYKAGLVERHYYDRKRQKGYQGFGAWCFWQMSELGIEVLNSMDQKLYRYESFDLFKCAARYGLDSGNFVIHQIFCRVESEEASKIVKVTGSLHSETNVSLLLSLSGGEKTFSELRGLCRSSASVSNGVRSLKESGLVDVRGEGNTKRIFSITNFGVILLALLREGVRK